MQGSSSGPGASSAAIAALDQSNFAHFASNSNTDEPQIPGRRTPLGAVGLGGFYFQGCQPNIGAPDENNPDPGCSQSQTSR